MSYNFKEGAAGETEEERKHRVEVKRKSRKRAIVKLTLPEKHEKQKAKRRKTKQPEAAAAAIEATPAAAAPPQPATLTAEAPLEQAEGPDRETQRDLALLRAWMWHRGDAEAVLVELRERGLDVLGEEDESRGPRRTCSCGTNGCAEPCARSPGCCQRVLTCAECAD